MPFQVDARDLICKCGRPVIQNLLGLAAAVAGPPGRSEGIITKVAAPSTDGSLAGERV